MIPIIFHNNSDEPVELALEPWGDTRTIAPRGAGRVELEVVEPPEITVAFNGEQVQLWARTGETLSFADD